ncbi:MAG: BREX system ATP-binding domain-containing protein, partial [Spirulina sp.]
SRQSNYDRLLAMFNDTMQGKAEHLGIVVCGTPQLIEDKRRGLYSDEAWRTRLAKSRFLQDGLQDSFSTAIALEPLTPEEISQLLQRLAELHASHYGYQKNLTRQQIDMFQQESMSRIGAEKMSTPREIIRDFISLLNVLQQNPQLVFTEILHSSEFSLTSPPENKNGAGEFAEFTL